MECVSCYSYFNWYDQPSFSMKKKVIMFLNWTGEVNDINFWNNNYKHPEEYLVYKEICVIYFSLNCISFLPENIHFCVCVCVCVCVWGGGGRCKERGWEGELDARGQMSTSLCAVCCLPSNKHLPAATNTMYIQAKFLSFSKF